MSESTTNLRLPYIMAAQAQKHVTHNEALRMIDALLQLVVIDVSVSSPPASATDGDRYIIPEAASGDWLNRAGEIAAYQDGAWQYFSPQLGWCCLNLSDQTLLYFSTDGWINLGFEPDALQLESLGVGSAATPDNPLTVSGASTLFTGSNGGHQVKLNKSDVADTSSLLFQSGFSGRAEVGLAGDDNLTVKVSDNATDWNDALVIDAASGFVTFPSGGVRKVLSAPLLIHVDASTGNDASSGADPGSALQTLHEAVLRTTKLDGNGFGATIQLAAGIYSLTTALLVSATAPGLSFIKIVGDTAAPENVVLDTNADRLLSVTGGEVLLEGVTVSGSGVGGLVGATATGTLKIGNVVFGETPGTHIEVTGGAVEIIGNYAINGNAQTHYLCSQHGILNIENSEISLETGHGFTAEFIRVSECSVVSISNSQFIGSASGRKYVLETNAVVKTFGATLDNFPGDVPGTQTTGAQHV